MPAQTQSSTAWWRRICGLAAGALLGTLAGCRSDRHEAAAIPPSEAAASPPLLATRVSPPKLPAAMPAATPSITLLRSPRSAESIESLYAGAWLGNGGEVRAGSLPPANLGARGAWTPDGTAGLDWDVPHMRAWRYIVVHHSASETGSAASFHRAHLARGWEGLGYHFVIGNGTGSRDGEVEVGYRWRQQERGAHAGQVDYNEFGIGICLVGNFENTNPSARQMASLRALARFLQARANIPGAHIIGHGHVPGKETRCPGRNFDVAGFRASLGGESWEVAARPEPLARPLPASDPLARPRPRPRPAAVRMRGAGLP